MLCTLLALPQNAIDGGPIADQLESYGFFFTTLVDNILMRGL